eukprot:COSAG02_NODE_849_length_16548_cov_6.418384_16_plen_193_part_00
MSPSSRGLTVMCLSLSLCFSLSLCLCPSVSLCLSLSLSLSLCMSLTAAARRKAARYCLCLAFRRRPSKGGALLSLSLAAAARRKAARATVSVSLSAAARRKAARATVSVSCRRRPSKGPRVGRSCRQIHLLAHEGGGRYHTSQSTRHSLAITMNSKNFARTSPHEPPRAHRARAWTRGWTPRDAWRTDKQAS